MKKNKQNTFRTSEVVFLVITTCILSFVMSMLIFKKDKLLVKKDEKDENIEKFVEQYNNIINNYYMEIDKDELINNAIKGMIDNLNDPHSNYFDTTEAKNFNIQLDGSYTGLGIEIIKGVDNKVYILNVFEGSNADKNGLQVGDIIVSADGKDLTEMTTDEFVNMVSANKGVKMVVQRNEETFEVQLTVSTITLKSVYSEMKEVDNKKIGYIRLEIFALNTYDQFKTALDSLEGAGMESLIIDLRGNTGGHLSTVDSILSLFLNKDKVIYQIKKQNVIEKYYSHGTKDKEYKMVILVDQNSASASELMTGALSEQLGAIVVGKQTYGKGTAQELITLPSGEQYKITTKEWLTANGNSINNVGITPSIDCEGDSCIEKGIEILKK